MAASPGTGSRKRDHRNNIRGHGQSRCRGGGGHGKGGSQHKSNDKSRRGNPCRSSRRNQHSSRSRSTSRGAGSAAGCRSISSSRSSRRQQEEEVAGHAAADTWSSNDPAAEAVGGTATCHQEATPTESPHGDRHTGSSWRRTVCGTAPGSSGTPALVPSGSALVHSGSCQLWSVGAHRCECNGYSCPQRFKTHDRNNWNNKGICAGILPCQTGARARSASARWTVARGLLRRSWALAGKCSM